MSKVTHDDRIKTMIKILTIAEFVEDNNDNDWLRFVDDVKEIIKFFEKEKYPMINLLRVRKGTSLTMHGSPVWISEDMDVKYYDPIYFKGKSKPIDLNKKNILSILPEGTMLHLNGTVVWNIEDTIIHHYADLSIDAK